MLVPLISFMLTACGPKTAPPVAAAAAPVATEPTPPPEPELPPEPPPPPPKVDNADMNVNITRADGTTVRGHVKRIERSADWYAETEWSTDAKDILIAIEGTGAYEKKPWTEIRTVDIKIGKTTDIDCMYSSEYTPWMYECVLPTTGTAVTRDRKKWTVDNRHKWRFTFDDDAQIEFWLKKHPARQQDEAVVDLNSGNPENYDLYAKLQQRLREEAKTTLVTRVSVE